MGMDGIGEPFQVGHDLLSHPKLTIERKAGAVNGSVCHRRHAHSSTGNGFMIVEQIIRRSVAVCHILKSCRAYHPIAQGDRTNPTWREYR
jgi:hypothetical protein